MVKKRKSICKKRVSDKIKINMKELKQGKFRSRKQAIAISYNQVSKQYPMCKQHLALKTKKSKSTRRSRPSKSTRRSRKPYSVKILDSSRETKKHMAIFYDRNGNKIKTTHFGAAGMSDYTKHKDPERKQRYISRHRKRENWNDPTSAGSLSRYILWQYPDPSESIAYYINKFNLKLVR